MAHIIHLPADAAYVAAMETPRWYDGKAIWLVAASFGGIIAACASGHSASASATAAPTAVHYEIDCASPAVCRTMAAQHPDATDVVMVPSLPAATSTDLFRVPDGCGDNDDPCSAIAFRLVK